jgi:hypothetical protein
MWPRFTLLLPDILVNQYQILVRFHHCTRGLYQDRPRKQKVPGMNLPKYLVLSDVIAEPGT